MNPALSFKDFMNQGQVHTILSSGTLRPFAFLEEQLDFQFDHKIVAKLEIDKWKRQLMVFKLDHLFRYEKGQLKFTFNRINQIELLGKCLKFIEHASRVTREGVLVFLPSYRVLENYKEVLQGKKGKDLMGVLVKNKDVFFEDKVDSTFLFQDFRVSFFMNIFYELLFYKKKI
jgi:Rad3-related DNA helicase